MRYKITFSYDGTAFYGYQKQLGHRTVQEEMEKAISYLNRQTKTIIHASGRTDRGVHAFGQVAHFDLFVSIPTHKIKMGLNSLLPEDIYVIDVIEVEEDFHARYMALKKEYIYQISMGEYDPLKRNYCYQLGKKLDILAMQDASLIFLGKHDFRSFVDSEDTRENTVRTIYSIDFLVDGDTITISFVGNGFMKYQVRNMVGALILVGLGKKSKIDIEFLLASKSREKALKAAPACGLALKRVFY